MNYSSGRSMGKGVTNVYLSTQNFIRFLSWPLNRKIGDKAARQNNEHLVLSDEGSSFLRHPRETKCMDPSLSNLNWQVSFYFKILKITKMSRIIQNGSFAHSSINIRN